MTRNENKPSIAAVKELMGANPDTLRAIVQDLLQEMLEGEMTEALEPGEHGLAGRVEQLKLGRPLRLLLYHICSVSYATTRHDVAEATLDNVAATQLAVDCEVEESPVAKPSMLIEPETDGRPIFPRLAGPTGLAGHALFGLVGRGIPECRVQAVSSILAFDVSEQRLPDLGPRDPSALMNAFDLQGVEEAFHRGIIVAIAGAAHRRHRADFRQMVDIGASRVLRSAIRVADETGRWSSPLRRHHQPASGS